MLEVAYPVIANTTLTANSTLPAYMLYLFNAGMALGFFSVLISFIIAGAMFFLSPINAQARAEAKDRVYGAISGLLILVLLYLIITTINPQLSFFRVTPLPETPKPETSTKKAPGIYFNLDSGCPNINTPANITNLPDLGKLKNKVSSVGIVQDSDNKTYYITILYGNPNFYGQCQYLNPNVSCHSNTKFTNSASIYKYDFNPNGDGVYFYRKSFFDKQGGYYKVSNTQIKNRGIYTEKLDNIKFIGVPDSEQNCINYENGECTGKTPPSLAGENISSVAIKGNYLVLFAYLGPKDAPESIWTSCQEFPTPNDVNKMGPQQIKWENIRNSQGVVPNYVIIIPIQNN